MMMQTIMTALMIVFGMMSALIAAAGVFICARECYISLCRIFKGK